jgi:ADP-heptose:LPS heptosyltransferase
MKILVVEGGAGRGVFFTALIPKLAEKEKIITMSSYPELYENSPWIFRSLSRATQYGWEDYIQKPEHEVVFSDPYFLDSFIKRKCHVLEAWAKQLNVEYTPDMLPEVYLSREYKDFAKEFKRNNGNFILIQFSSGQSALNFNPNVPFAWTGFRRDYPLERAQMLVDMIKEKHPKLQIVNYCLPNEQSARLKNVIMFPAGFMHYIALLEQAETFIGINSSLMHFATAVRKKGITLWGGTSEKQWGYDMHVNISGECPEIYCSRPYLRELGDFVGNGARWSCPTSQCMDIQPEKIVAELDTILKNMVIVEPVIMPQTQNQNCEECK